MTKKSVTKSAGSSSSGGGGSGSGGEERTPSQKDSAEQTNSIWKVYKAAQLAKDPHAHVEGLHSRFKAMTPAEKVT